jgi:hypothetical protein
MSNEKKKEKISKPNFGHTEDEWGTARKFSGKEKKYCECLACKDTIEKRKKNLDSKRIVAYKLNNE